MRLPRSGYVKPKESSCREVTVKSFGVFQATLLEH